MPREYRPVIEVECPAPTLDELMRTLGDGPCAGMDEQRVRRIAAQHLEAVHPKGVFKSYNPAICTLPPDYTEPAIKLVGTMTILHGRTAYEKLERADRCVLMAVTLGDPQALDALRGADRGTADAADPESAADPDAAIADACVEALRKYTGDVVNAAIVKWAMDQELTCDDRLGLHDTGFPASNLSDILFYTQASSLLGFDEEAPGYAPTGCSAGIVAAFKPGKGRRRSCGLCKFREFCSIRAIGMTCHGRKGAFKDE